MAKRRNTFVVGLTVLVMLGVAIFVVVFIGASELRGKPKRPITVRFAPTLALPPLKENSTIFYAGRPVGFVQKLWLDYGTHVDKKTGNERKLMFLYVKAHVRNDLELREGCTIVPEGPILGGAGNLRIQDQGTGEPLEPNAVIEGQGMGGLAAVTEQLTDIGGLLTDELDASKKESIMALIKMHLNTEASDSMMARLVSILSLVEEQLNPQQAESLMAKLIKTMEDVNAVSASLRNEFDPNQEKVLLAKLHTTFDHINDITQQLRNQMDPASRTALLGKLQLALDTVNDSLGQVSGMLQDNRPTITATLDNIHETSNTLNKEIARSIAGELNAKNPTSLLGKIHSAVDRVASSLEDLNEITASANEIMTLNKGSLDQLLSNFKETSDHLKAATKDLRRNPWRLLYRPSLQETKELNIFDAARAFSEAATQLDDATARLEGLVEAHEGKVPADDPQLKIIRSQLQETFQKFSEAEAALWKVLNIQP